MKGKEGSQDLFRRPWDQTGGKQLKLTGASKEETAEETERKKGQNQSKQAHNIQLRRRTSLSQQSGLQTEEKK